MATQKSAAGQATFFQLDQAAEVFPQPPARPETTTRLDAGTTTAGSTERPRTVLPAAPAVEERYRFPFTVRYGLDSVELLGFVDGQEYTKAQVKELLVSHCQLPEFGKPHMDLLYHAETNSFIVSALLNKKGALGTIPAALLLQTQDLFKETFAKHGTEDRLLVYRNEKGELWAVQPPMKRSVDEVEILGALQTTVIHEGQTWGLMADLHSHHHFGAFWSEDDDENEYLRRVVYGVFSWQGGQDVWLFRHFTGTELVPLHYAEVVVDG